MVLLEKASGKPKTRCLLLFVCFLLNLFRERVGKPKTRGLLKKGNSIPSCLGKLASTTFAGRRVITGFDRNMPTRALSLA